MPKSNGKSILLSRFFATAMVVFCLFQLFLFSRLRETLSNDHSRLFQLLQQQQLLSPSSLSCQEEPVSKQDGFSACAIIMDDNHFLIEWLAYHYQTLPLKRLIVAIDPRSRTSPTQIFDRYRRHGLMDITEWTNETEYFPREQQERRFQVLGLNGTEYAKEMHYARQRRFYAQCLSTLRQEDKTWTALIDTDEYLLYNANAGIRRRRIAPDRQHKTVWSTLEMAFQQENHSNCHNLGFLGETIRDNPCYLIPRLTFGTKSNTREEIDNQVPNIFENGGLDFSTMRWRWHGGLANQKVNGHLKGIIDLSRVSPNYVFQAETTVDVHSPARHYCDKQGRRTNAMSFFVVHHYMGTWEQWGFRKDVRRTKKIWEQKNYDAGQDDNIRPWLTDFVNAVGEDLAKELLQGVGQVEQMEGI